MNYSSHLGKWVEEVARISNSQRNLRLKDFWTRFLNFELPSKVPITIGFSRGIYAKELGINLVEMFQKPEKYLEDTLKMILFQRQNFPDDGIVGATFGNVLITEHLSGEILVYFGPPFETSLFGIEPIFRPDIDPVRGKPIIKSEDDLDRLNYPDFYISGLMPKIHKFYEEICKITGDRLNVVFPRFISSPFSLAWAMRGMQELIIDAFTNPDFVHKLMRFVTESRIRWEKERRKFIGSEPTYPILDNDEVNCDVISPRIYREFVFPYERTLGEFYNNGIFYFHSCGNITLIYDEIAKLPGLKRLEISPWSDFKVAVEKFKARKIILQKRLSSDDLRGERRDIVSKLEEILNLGSEVTMELDVLDGPTEAAKKWVHTAKELVKIRSRSVLD